MANKAEQGKQKAAVLPAAFVVLGALLVVAAVALAGYNLVYDRSAEQRAQQVLEDVRAQMPEHALLDYAAPSGKLVSVQVDGRSYVGIVELPALDVCLPVQSTWSEENVDLCPGVLAGTPYEGNLVLGGMNYASHFGRIADMADGETVTFTDMNAHTFTYRVASAETVDARDWDAIRAGGDWNLALFCNTYSGMQATVVRCVAQHAT